MTAEPETTSAQKPSTPPQTLPQPASSTDWQSPVTDQTVQLWKNPLTVFTTRHWMSEVDSRRSAVPLIAYCFMTGLMDAVSYTAFFIWTAFQTGNSVQLALALARSFAHEQDTSFRIGDQQALTSLTTFLGGAFLGRIGIRMGDRTRAWLFLGTLIQALFTMAAAIAAWQSGQPSVAPSRAQPAWTNATTFVALGFMSASMGLQGIMGKRLNTDFATTVVLTSVWCDLMVDKDFFAIHKRSRSRDYKILAIFSLFLGGFVGRAIIDSAGAPTALGVGAGIRALVAISWLFVPGK